MTSHRLSLAVAVLGCALLGGTTVSAMLAPANADRAPLTVDAPGLIRLAQAQPSPAPTPDAQAPAAAPSDQQNPADEPIGNVASLTGVATVTRNNAATPLQLKDDIYLNDVVETQASSSLGITFNDATTFRLSANAQITIDNYVYEENGSNNAGVFDIAKGTVAFVAASVAKTGNMQITTPTATLGIRGTTGLVEVPEGAATANNVNIKLYPDADGRVGRIELNDRQGARLGVLTQGASGFSIRPGMGGGRLAAVPLTISPQQQQRDQGFVRQVHATQTAGRQIVTEQRAFRRANPGFNNRNNPARPGQPQQPNQNRPGQPGQPGQNRPGQPPQPGTPNKRGGQQPPRPGTPGQPTTPPRAGQNTTPANSGATGDTTAPGSKRDAGKPGAARYTAASGTECATGNSCTARHAAATWTERTADNSDAIRNAAEASSERDSGPARRVAIAEWPAAHDARRAAAAEWPAAVAAGRTAICAGRTAARLTKPARRAAAAARSAA